VRHLLKEICVLSLSMSLALNAALALSAQTACPKCDEWNARQEPFQIWGNTYYVGVKGLSSILITSPQGHILIDGANPESPPLIVANIRALGFRIEDVKLILNSHVHFDHAGGIAELQRLSGAEVAASPWSAEVLRSGRVGRGDPITDRPAPARVARVRSISDGQALKVGPLTVKAHFTPGHTPGGTTWSWRSCEGSNCLNMVYADSLNAVSTYGFRFTDDPDALRGFQRSFVVLDSLPCDVLLTDHPELSDVFGRHQRSVKNASRSEFADTTACRRYVEFEKDVLHKRLEDERRQ
jgi:metallo-beta-lactamase class B